MNSSNGCGVDVEALDGKGLIELSFAVILINDGGERNRIFAPIRFSGQFGHAADPQTTNLRSFFPLLVIHHG